MQDLIILLLPLSPRFATRQYLYEGLAHLMQKDRSAMEIMCEINETLSELLRADLIRGELMVEKRNGTLISSAAYVLQPAGWKREQELMSAAVEDNGDALNEEQPPCTLHWRRQWKRRAHL